MPTPRHSKRGPQGLQPTGTTPRLTGGARGLRSSSSAATLTGPMWASGSTYVHGLRLQDNAARPLEEREPPSPLIETGRRPPTASASGLGIMAQFAQSTASSTPPISIARPARGEDEEHHLSALGSALRESEMMRAESAHAIDGMSRDFERDFKAGDPQRRAASSLVVKACKMVSRLTDTCAKLEYAAASALDLSWISITDREAVIRALQEGITGSDAAASWVQQQMVRTMDMERLEHQQRALRAEVSLHLLHTEVSASEAAVEAIREYAKEMGVKFDDEKRNAVQHLYRFAVKRLAHYSLGKGWRTWQYEFTRNVLVKRTALARFRNQSLLSCLRKWIEACPPKTRLHRALQPYLIRIEDLENSLRRESACLWPTHNAS